ncbi:MAG: porin family protein [Saprospiraceae bacterium]|nr:porin family protein [Saprospiraceae bacterium]MDZ4706324.1 porin family protein [Saprospiraceae bacterium]
MRHLHLIYTLCLCALILPFTSTTQCSWSGGLVTGLNVANIRHDNEALSSNPKLGFLLGIRVACHPSDRLVIQAEALIERKGSQVETTLTDIEGNPISEMTTAKDHFEYLVFPLTVQWRFGSGNFRYGPYAGAYVAKLIRQTFVFTLEDESFRQDRTDFFQKSDAGMVIGLGAGWALDDMLSLNLEARYNHGLTYFQPAVLSSDRTRHQSLALMAALQFTF